MIIKAENNLVFKNKNPIEIEKSNTQIENIRQYWNEFVKDNKEVYNGNVYCVTNIAKQKK